MHEHFKEVKWPLFVMIESMIKTIVFDLGGVVFAEGKTVAMQRLNEELGYDPKIISGIISSSQSEDMRRGLLSDEAFWQWVSRQVPQGYNVDRIQQAWYEGYVPDMDIFTLVSNLRGKYRLVIYSDNIKSRVEFIDHKHPFRSLFDAEVYSYEHHLIKTDIGFVDALLPVCQAESQEIVLIDDKEKAVTEARDAGLNVLIYKRGEIEKLKTILKDLGVTV